MELAVEAKGGDLNHHLAHVAEEFWGSVNRGADERHVHLPSGAPNFSVLPETEFAALAQMGDEEELHDARLKEQANYEEEQLIKQFSERVRVHPPSSQRVYGHNNRDK